MKKILSISAFFILLIGLGVLFLQGNKPLKLSLKDRMVLKAYSMFDDSRYVCPLGDINHKLDKYTTKELEQINEDFHLLKEYTFAKAKKGKSFIATAGGPASFKSTALENEIDGQGYAFIDPDKSCLFRMEKTYLRDIRSKTRTPEEAYNHWREASHFLAGTFLGYALKHGYIIAHGTTSTAPNVETFMNCVKDYGYHFHLLHMSAPDHVRIQADKIKKKNGMFQCTEEDLIRKGKWFYERLPVYLRVADKITFYVKEDIGTISRPVAVKRGNKFSVKDQAGYDLVIKLHNEAQGDQFFQKLIASND